MATPIVSWYDETHTNPIAQPFNFGVIDADDLSPVYVFNIWNNKNGNEDVPKMEECTITTRDMGGGTGDTLDYDIEVVKNNWFHAQVDSLGETDLALESSRIGKDYTKAIGTTGSTTKNHSGTVYSPVLTPSSQEILGVNNNGIPVDSAGNFVTVSLQADVPLDAKSGQQEFKIRISYRYV